MKKIGRGQATAKIILGGEHAVVYGKPAIALPFPAQEAVVTVQNGTTDIVIATDDYRAFLNDMTTEFLGLQTLIKTTLAVLKKENATLRIGIHSTIQRGGGMGSSAAVSIAVVRALFDFFEEGLEDEQLLDLVMLAERIHHANPSGLDAQVIVSASPIWFQKGQGFEPIALNLKGILVVADTGAYGDTQEAVNAVRTLYEQEPERIAMIFKEMSHHVHHMRQCLETNNQELGQDMNALQELLQQLTLSNRKLDMLVERAQKAGALGAKLTGSGRGGSMIAFCETEAIAKQVASALKEQGAVQTFIYNF